MTLEIISLVAGLAMSFFLFRHFPRLSAGHDIKSDSFLSVIIPARNEEKNLPLILADLKNQVGVSYEVICVDDGSTDKTRAIAKAFGVQVISVRDKPAAWLGKSWACQKGAQAAKGEVLLFVDADVRLGPDALKRLLGTYGEKDQPLSVLPYHQMEKAYEQVSLFFNLTQVSANGLAMPGGKKIGLYGPIILLGAGDYWQIDGHDRVKGQVIEDVALGMEMTKAGLAYRLFMGDLGLSYRMYAGGFLDLYQGWLKNYGSGAAVTPLIRLIMVFLWVTGVTATPLYLIRAVLAGQGFYSLVFGAFYLSWLLELRRIGKKVGNFHFLNILFYPLSLSFFIIVFFGSAIKRLFHLKSSWKGRKV